jgi:Ca2+:H+ antiporter
MDSGDGHLAGVSTPWWGWGAPLAAGALLAGHAAGVLPAEGAVFLAAAPVVLVLAVFAAVRHAETVSVRLGETLGTVVLALAVTAIEVALIASVMLEAEHGSHSVARDTVFAGVMIVLNGIVGLALLAGGLRHGEQRFQLQGTASALGVLGTLAGIAMVLPDFTVSEPGPFYSRVQLVFVSMASLGLYAAFLFAQAFSQRDHFSPVEVADAAHGAVSGRAALVALGLLAAALAGVVLLGDALAPAVHDAVLGLGLPLECVAVVIAAVVLLPEGSSAVRAARDDRLQTGLNFALGSAIASTGLTIPTIALLSALLDEPLALGLEPEHVVLLILSLFVSTLTLSTGRTTVLQGSMHLVLFVVFLVIAAVP